MQLTWPIGIILLYFLYLIYREIKGQRKRRLAIARREERTRAHEDQVFGELTEVAQRRGWTCEFWPSPSLWYRLQGKSELGITWQLIQGTPLEDPRRVNQGLRWSTDDVKLKHLSLEIFPRRTYERLKRLTTLPDLGDMAPFSASQKLIAGAPTAMFIDPTLNRRYIMVTFIPTVAQMLFTPEIEKALVAIGSDSVRIGLGFPNLRVSVERVRVNGELAKDLVDFSVQLAERYNHITQEEELSFNSILQ